jgi:O-antigen ligase
MTAPKLDRLQLGLFGAFVASTFVSIFAAQAFLVAGLLVFAARLSTRSAPCVRTPADGPILAFAAFTLLSVAFSVDPGASLDHAKKLLLLAVFVLATDTLAFEKSRERALHVALLAGTALAGLMVIQFHLLGFDGLHQRPQGFLGHYMSATGLVMTVLVVAAARLGFSRDALRPDRADIAALAALGGGLVVLALAKASGTGAVVATRLFVVLLSAAGAFMATTRGPWPGRGTGNVLAALALPVCGWALLVSRTRNAWLGALAGVAVVALLRKPKALFALAGLVAAVFLARPTAVIDRLTVTDASSIDRYYQWQAGVDMIKDRPWFGQGPGMILRTYPKYRWPEAPNTQAPHLHDNALQIAAERGLLCLGAWLWWMATSLADSWREVRSLLRGTPPRGPAWVAVAALAGLLALMAAGLFEYNFGDSEVLMFLLLVAALPYALRRGRALFPA